MNGKSELCNKVAKTSLLRTTRAYNVPVYGRGDCLTQISRYRFWLRYAVLEDRSSLSRKTLTTASVPGASHNAQAKLLFGMWHEDHSAPMVPMDQPQILCQLLATSEERTIDPSSGCLNRSPWHRPGGGSCRQISSAATDY